MGAAASWQDQLMSSDIETIRTLEDGRYRSIVEQDVAFLDELFHDNCRYTHSSGLVDTKASYIEAIRRATFNYKAVRRLKEEIQVIGDTAIISGHVELDVAPGGNARTINAAVTVTYGRIDGAWKFLAWQSCPLAAG